MYQNAGGVRMNRKEIVKILGEYFETTHRYLGAPSFAYEIEIKDEIYTVGRYGNITTQDGRELILEDIINVNQPNEQFYEGYTEVPRIENLGLRLPMEGHTGETLKNIVNMLSSKQHLIKKSLEMNKLLMDETFAEDLSYKQITTIDDFKVAIEELGKERLRGITFDFDNEIYAFNISVDGLENDKINAFALLATQVDESSKKQKRTSYKPVQDDNPKYAFRTWLIRLGMKGIDYKETRKVLLANLNGSGAFRKQ
jgi:hypothetical protein